MAAFLAAFFAGFFVAGGSSSDSKAAAVPPAGAFYKPTLNVGVNPGGVSLLGTF